jgi:hypothetical protein
MEGGDQMESSDQTETSSQLRLDHAGGQNAGLVTFLHIVMVLMIVFLIVGYIVAKA